MKFRKGFVKEEREKIFGLFLENSKLKFNQIEKETDIRSNMVSYHLNVMKKEGLIEKKNDYYFLTKNAESYLPILSNLIGGELSALPVILVALLNKNKILMIKRNRRPYKDYWSLIGGKILLDEDVKSASLRQIKEKTSLSCKYVGLKSIFHERVKEGKQIRHNFILFFTKTNTSENNFKESPHGILKWFDLKEVGKNEKVIPSDLWLIRNKLNSNLKINEATMVEKDGKLSRFKVN